MGLLDGLMSDDARLGIGLLAAGGYQPTKMSFGQRVSQALQGEDARKQEALKAGLLKMQMDDAKNKAEFESQQRPLLLNELQIKNQQHKLLYDLVNNTMGAKAGGLASPTAAPVQSDAPSQGQAAATAPTGQQAAPSGAFDAELRSAQALSYLDPAKGRAQLEVLKLKYPDLGEHQGILFNKRTGQAVTSMPFGTATGSVIQYQPQPGGGFGVSSPAGANDVLRQQARIRAEEEARFKPYETKATGQTDYPQVWPLLDVLQQHPGAPAIAPPASPNQQTMQVGAHPAITDDLLDRVQKRESGGNPYAVSPKGAMGPYQFMPGTAAGLQKTFGPFNPFDEKQARAAAQFELSRLAKKYNGNVDLALAAYNAGEDAVDKAKGIPNYPETQNYVRSILAGGTSAGQGARPQAAPAPANAIGPSPKVEADIAANREFQIGDAKARQEQYANMQKQAMNNQAKIAKFERVGALLGDYSGGKLAPTGYELARIGTSLGITIDPKLSNKEAANALSNEIALELRSTGDGAGMPGAMSDADREFLKSMAPQLAQTAAGRKKIIESRVAVMKREQLIAEMARRYRAKHGSIDETFYSQLQQWSDRNPIFKNAN